MTPPPRHRGVRSGDRSARFGSRLCRDRDGDLQTTNRGEDWLLVEAFPRTISVAIDPHNAATVIAGTWDDWTWKAHLPTDRARLCVTGVFQPHGGGAAFTSSDGGETWHRLGNHWVGKITVDPLVPTTLYITQPIGFGGPTGIFRSTNRGDNWTAFNTGLTNLDASSVTLDATGTFLYAVTPSGIFVQELRVPARRRGAGK